MKRPEARNPRRRDPFGVALMLLAVVSAIGADGIGRLVACAGFAAMLILDQRPFRSAQSIGAKPFPLVIGLMFLAAVAGILLGASPLAPGGAHPLWRAVGIAGAASIDLEADWLGLLGLLGLAFVFLTTARVGGRAGASGLLTALSGLGALLGALALTLRSIPLVSVYLTPILQDAGLRGAFFGVILIVSTGDIVRGWKARSGRPLDFGYVTRQIRAATIAWAAAFVAAICLLSTATAPAMTDAVIVMAWFAAWTALVGGGATKVPRRVLIWLAPAAALLAAIVAILAVQRLAEPPGSAPALALARAAHWNAFWASPWLGYGLNTQGEVAKLFMTRLNLEAMQAFPSPPQAFLAWLEQGGLLVTLPLLAIIVWITVRVMIASIGARRSATLMRTVACASLYLALLGLTSAAPAAFSIELLWVVLLGLGYGAANPSR